MPARRCPHCGLVNPARSMSCDCGYSFVDGSPPRHSPSQPQFGGADAASRLMTRVIVRVALIVLFVGGAVAIRACA